ncbi:MAG: Gfo/Idh/MocA family oxidoreductase [Planctomycetota bacterium]
MKRRDFLQSTLATASLTSLSPLMFLGDESRKPTVGLIGSGWYGKCDLLQLLNVADVDVVSLCDVDSRMVDEAAELVASRQTSKQRPKVYADYRKQLQDHQHDIVLIATPDHWHSLPMIAAVESGAHVYCQKPTGTDVLESKAMLDAARQHNRVVQIGTQRRSTPHLIEAKQRVVDEGLLGDIAHVDICCYYHMRTRKTKAEAPDKPAPDFLNWEAYTGPAPMRPFNDIVHPRGWRAFMEYSNGIVGDMCVHMLDLTRFMLDLGWPERVSSAGGILVDTESRANTTDTQTATFHYPDLNVVWTHRCWGHPSNKEYPWSAIIYGDKGTLKLSVQKYEFEPRGKGQRMSGEAVIELDKYPQDKSDQQDWAMELHVGSAIRGHMRDFLDAIKEDRKPIADIEQGHISSASCFLANVAMDVGRTLAWDPDLHRVTNVESANKRLKRKWRKPYQHPAG